MKTLLPLEAGFMSWTSFYFLVVDCSTLYFQKCCGSLNWSYHLTNWFSIHRFGSKLIGILIMVFSIFILRKSFSKWKTWKKQQRIILPTTSDNSGNIIIHSKYNNITLNPEIINFKMHLVVFLVVMIVCFPAYNFYYLSYANGQPEWSEFQFFSMDLSIHFALSVIRPCIVYAQSSKSRSYLIKSFKHIFNLQ